MYKLNKKLIKAGIAELIKSEKIAFIERLAYYIQEKPGLTNFLMDGFIPINKEVQEKIAAYIKTTLPCKEYFKGITDIKVTFDYEQEQQYTVHFNVSRFYANDDEPLYAGKKVSDEEHKYERTYNEEVTISPEALNNSKNYV